MDPQQNQTLWEIILQLHRESRVGFAIFYGSIAFCVLAALFALWQIWGWGPRRRRGMRAARKQLAAGDWKNALEQLKRIRAMGPASASWTNTFNDFEAECLQAASASAVEGKRFDEAFEFSKRAAEIEDKPEHEVRMVLQSS